MSFKKVTAIALSALFITATALPAAAQNRERHRGGQQWSGKQGGGHQANSRGQHGGHRGDWRRRDRGGISTGAAIGLGLGAAALGGLAAQAHNPYGYAPQQCAYGYVWRGHWSWEPQC
jgi:hypothetical protein